MARAEGLAAAEAALEDAHASRKRTEEEYDAAADQFDAAERPARSRPAL
jgi:hypothetical protein